MARVRATDDISSQNTNSVDSLLFDILNHPVKVAQGQEGKKKRESESEPSVTFRPALCPFYTQPFFVRLPFAYSYRKRLDGAFSNRACHKRKIATG